MQLNFLGSGPVFDLTLPGDGADWTTPATKTVVDWGAGGREVSASVLSGDMLEGQGLPPLANEAFVEVVAPEGSSNYVDVYFREEEPHTWIVRWRVGDFRIATHVRDYEGRDAVDVVIGDLDFALSPESGLPIAILGASMRLAVAEFPNFQETISLSRTGITPNDLGAVGVIDVRRPSSLLAGDRMVAYTDPAYTFTRAGRGGGVEVMATSYGDQAAATALGEVDEILSVAAGV